jgi:DNA mismatch repair protein MutL
LGHALEHAFREVTPEARYPVACLRLDMDPATVDVNVHPTKMEVKFTYERELHAAVVRAVTDALRRHGVLPELRSATPTMAASAQKQDGRPAPAIVEAAVSAFRPLGQEAGSPSEAPRSNELPGSAAAEAVSLAEQLREFRVLGQLRDTYIVAATADGVAFVDQHVAHERVLYERLTAKRTEQGIPSQRLAVPLTISFGPAEGALLEQRLEEFTAAGWEIEPFGRNSYAIRAAPALIRQDRYESVLRDMVDELAHQSVARRLIVDRDQVTIAHACRLAVKAGDVLSVEEMTGLLEQLARTTNPHLCPHGRPAVVVVPYAELDRRFRR